MSPELDNIISDAASNMQRALNHLEQELTKVRAGKASPVMLDGIVAEYYGSPTPISQVATISVLDARTITVTPFEKNMLQVIDRAISAANIGINPQNDGNVIRLFLPPLTEERRKEMVKKAGAEGEQAKISIRNIRRDAIEHVKKLQKDGASEDECKDAEAAAQNATDKFITMVDKYLAAKEVDIMAV
jgi:ribosome recycling factor